MMINSLGLLEVSGLVAGIDAADAMVKTADVRILRYELVSPGLVTLVVEGDLAACRAALDAGACAAKRLGHVISQKEIGRPDGDTEWLVTEGFIKKSVVSPSLPPSSPPSSPSMSTSSPCSSTSANACSSSSVLTETIGEQAVATPDSAPLLLVNIPSTQINAEPMSYQQQDDAVNEETMTLTVQALLDELQRDSHGMTVSEVAAHFSCSNEIAKKRLDTLWRAGVLRKRNSRYRCKQINEKAAGEIGSVSDQITSDNQEKK